ncbi:hypothetical protein [Nannocystis punicea]|uniref:Uncharacterized protein n=1 Tax=Nannocystis punicea TaxID=2995304 RepID=A0ABY7HI49_9BACT|nr:hypothetical protein [Nannocystis poenicansa]WAS98999.1 hypothetical protein O0S08_22960 [Nannocystis poenicansa]
MTRPGLGLVLVALSFAPGVLSCVLPDREIEFEQTSITNRYAVRIIEPVLLSKYANDSCDTNDEDMMAGRCPQPGDSDPRDAPPHFLDPTNVEFDGIDDVTKFAFCTCPEPLRDTKLFDFTVYVEDQDEEPRKRTPKDDIYAALLLDVPSRSDTPYDHVDYLSYYDPEGPLEDYTEIPYKPPGRRDPQLRRLLFGSDQEFGIDLCNGGRERLSEGFHTLTVIVTDRAWFLPPEGARQYGVPDIANGATYDSIHYVFSCDTDCDTQCQSEEEAQ